MLLHSNDNFSGCLHIQISPMSTPSKRQEAPRLCSRSPLNFLLSEWLHFMLPMLLAQQIKTEIRPQSRPLRIRWVWWRTLPSVVSRGRNPPRETLTMHHILAGEQTRCSHRSWAMGASAVTWATSIQSIHHFPGPTLHPTPKAQDWNMEPRKAWNCRALGPLPHFPTNSSNQAPPLSITWLWLLLVAWQILMNVTLVEKFKAIKDYKSIWNGIRNPW